MKTLSIILIIFTLYGWINASTKKTQHVIAANIQDTVFRSSMKGVSSLDYGRVGHKTSGFESLSRIDVKKIKKTLSKTFNKVHLNNDEFNIKQCPDVKCHLSLTFVLDSSTSVGSDNFGTQLRFVKTLIEIMAMKADHYDLKVCLGMVTYSTYVRAVSDPCCENSLCSMIEHIEKREVDYRRGGTNTSVALKVARQMSMATSSKYKAVFLITDGKSNYGGSPKNIAKMMREEDDIEIMALGVGNSINEKELKMISGSNYVAKIDYFDEFHGLADLLLQANEISQEDLDKTIHDLCKKDTGSFRGTKCDGEVKEMNCNWKSITECTGHTYCFQFWECIDSDGTLLRKERRRCPCTLRLQDMFMKKSNDNLKIHHSSGERFLEDIRRGHASLN